MRSELQRCLFTRILGISYCVSLCLVLPGVCLHFFSSPSAFEDDLFLSPLVVLVALLIRPMKVLVDTKQMLRGKLWGHMGSLTWNIYECDPHSHGFPPSALKHLFHYKPDSIMKVSLLKIIQFKIRVDFASVSPLIIKTKEFCRLLFVSLSFFFLPESGGGSRETEMERDICERECLKVWGQGLI